MKRLAVLAAVLAVFSAETAFADVQDFENFTADVPSGWTAKQDNTMLFISKNGTEGSGLVAVSIMPGSANGHSAKDIAESFVRQLKDAFPLIFMPEADENGDYVWNMVNSDGLNIHSVLRVENEIYVLTMMSGFDTAGEEISAILGSIKIK